MHESRAGRRITARKMIETNWIKLRKEKHSKKKKMMKRLEGLNDEERLKELNTGRLAKCRLKAAIRTVCCTEHQQARGAALAGVGSGREEGNGL